MSRFVALHLKPINGWHIVIKCFLWILLLRVDWFDDRSGLLRWRWPIKIDFSFGTSVSVGCPWFHLTCTYLRFHQCFWLARNKEYPYFFPYIWYICTPHLPLPGHCRINDGKGLERIGLLGLLTDSFIAAVIRLFITFKMIKLIIDILIRRYQLQSRHGCRLAFFGAIWNSITYLLLRDNNQPIHQPEHESPITITPRMLCVTQTLDEKIKTVYVWAEIFGNLFPKGRSVTGTRLINSQIK